MDSTTLKARETIQKLNHVGLKDSLNDSFKKKSIFKELSLLCITMIFLFF